MCMPQLSPPLGLSVYSCGLDNSNRPSTPMKGRCQACSWIGSGDCSLSNCSSLSKTMLWVAISGNYTAAVSSKEVMIALK